MATAEDWRIWRDTIRSGSPEGALAMQQLYEAARAQGQAALARGYRIRNDEAVDLVHDTLATSLEPILDAESPLSFFLVSLRNRAVDQYRRRRRERPLEDREETGREPKDPADTEAPSHAQQVLAFLADELSARDNRIFGALAGLGLSAREVAKQEGVTPANVYQIVSRTRRRLKERFGEDPC